MTPGPGPAGLSPAGLLLLGSLAATVACAGSRPAGDPPRGGNLFLRPPTVGVERMSDDPVAGAVDGISAARIEADVRRLAAFGTRHTLSDTLSDTRGIGAATRWVKAQFDSISAANDGRLQVRVDRFVQPAGPRMPSPAHLANVVAVLPGTAPAGSARMYVVGGHLDSRSTDVMEAKSDAPGADDDGSGTAVVLELARVLSPRSFDGTLVFAVFTGEEQGLYGSTHYAEAARARGDRIAAMITNDIVGNTRGGDGSMENGYVRVFSEGVPAEQTPAEARLRAAVGGENDSPSRQWARYVAEAAATYLTGFEARPVFRRDRYLRGGDHIPFNQAGYPAVRFSEPHEDYRHQHQDVRVENGVQYGDLPRFVDYAYAAQVARVNAAALAEAASSPAEPESVSVDVSGLAYDTTLRWRAGPGPGPAGYRVVWRATTDPAWTHRRDLGRVTTVTLPLSKDDFIFGVQALDRDGHPSPAVVPVPHR